MKAMMFCTDRHGAREALKYMLEEGIVIVGCVFDEQRPNRLSKLCQEHNITAYTTEELYSGLEKDQLPSFDFGISYLYHRRLRESIISFASQGIINFHPAPVSVHKGVAACCYCLLQGYEEWAVTAHYVSAKIDEGDVIEEHWFPMSRMEENGSAVTTAVDIEQLIQRESLLLFQKIIKKLLANEQLPRIPQDLEQGTYFSRKDLEQIKDVTGLVDTQEIDKRIHALWFPPNHGAFVVINGKKYSLVTAELLSEISELYENANFGQ